MSFRLARCFDNVDTWLLLLGVSLSLVSMVLGASTSETSSLPFSHSCQERILQDPLKVRKNSKPCSHPCSLFLKKPLMDEAVWLCDQF
jgi:Tfp pilus assembly protein PilN